MSDIDGNDSGDESDRSVGTARIDSVDHGVRTVLLVSQLLRKAVSEGRSARITVPIAYELRGLLEATSDRAEAEEPDLVPDLAGIRKSLDQTIRLIDGGFPGQMVDIQMGNIIDAATVLIKQ